VRGACIQCAQLSSASVESGGYGSDVTGFGSFDNSTCERVLDLLETGDLRLVTLGLYYVTNTVILTS